MPTADGAVGVDLKADLEDTLKALANADKKLVTGFRRAVRESGAAVIAEMSSVLDTESPSSLTQSRFTGKFRDAATRGHSNRGARETIKAGLRTRFTVSAKRGASVKVVTTTAQPAKAFNSRQWSHLTFGHEPTVNQSGIQYFKRGGSAGARAMRQALEKAIKEAVAEVN